MNSSRNSFEMVCCSRFIILQSVVTRYLFVQKVVKCCVYKMTGNKGWDGQKIWVPNIKLPDNAIYYDVAEADE